MIIGTPLDGGKVKSQKQAQPGIGVADDWVHRIISSPRGAARVICCVGGIV